MKALCWYDTKDVRVENVPDPTIINPHDAIVKVSKTAICGSDIHLYDGYIPTMEKGDILGHEFMGEIVDVGREVKNVQKGDRVVVPFPIACGHCHFCEDTQTSACDNTNPNARLAEKLAGYSGAGIFGYSHLYGGYAGGQAEYVRVPFADFGPLKIPDGIDDEQVLFLSDILPTGYMAAEACDIKPGSIVAVFGAGPVGLFALKSARLLGAERVIAVDRFPERLAKAAEYAQAETINYADDDAQSLLREMTGGMGPHACIDAVGMEAHGVGVQGLYDKIKQTFRLETDRPVALREAIMACRKGGVVSVPGVYGGLIDKFPFGAAFAKALTFKMGQTHVHRYMRPLLKHILNGDIDPTQIITHRMSLSEAPKAYEIFTEKKDDCIKVVLTP